MKKLLNFGKPYTMGLFKELFLGLLLLLLFTNFSYGTHSYYDSLSVNSNQYLYIGDNSCFSFTSNGCARNFTLYESDKQTVIFNAAYNADGSNNLYCTHTGGYLLNTYGSSCTIRRYSNAFDCGGGCPECEECEECQECPAVDTGAILSGYIAISDITTNYCVSNDLCPVYSGSRSELVINNIAHEGRPLINISIPDYITWDYSVNNNQYDIYVGSGYDQEYIDSVLAINSYRPDSGDFTNIFVSGLTLIFPYIFLALLIIFMWKLLKRIFK